MSIQLRLVSALAAALALAPLVSAAPQGGGLGEKGDDSGDDCGTMTPLPLPGGKKKPGSLGGLPSSGGAGAGGGASQPGVPSQPLPGTPGPSPIPAAPGASAVGTPRSLLAAADQSDWWHWWAYHKELYLDLDATLARLHPRTPASDGTIDLTGRRNGLSAKVVYGRVVPSILKALADEASDPRLVRQSLLALGRMGEAPLDVDSPRIVDVITPYLSDGRLVVIESAAIALGALASPEAVMHLRSLLLDTEDGRALTGGGRVSIRVRALAAYGLGMCGGMDVSPAVRQYAVHALAEVLEDEDTDYPDVQAAAVIALGLVPVEGLAMDAASSEELPPGAGLDAQVQYLMAVLADERGPRMARTHAPTALARLLAVDPDGTRHLRDQVLTSLLGVTHPRSKARDDLRRSAVIAMGEVANSGGSAIDREVRAQLVELMKKGDVPTRHFATMALARAGGRVGTDAEPWVGAEQATKVFVRQLLKGKDRTRPWAGLALGVLAYHLRAEGESLDVDAVAALHHALGKVRQPLDAAALALGAGLVMDSGAYELVCARIDDTSDPVALEHLSLALGLLRERTGIHVLSAVMDDAKHKSGLMEAAALGRALIADRALVADLVGRLDDCDCAVSTRGVSRGLAWAGDHRAVLPLIGMLEDEELPSGTRANAIEALGRIADRSTIPWDVRISAGLDYLDAPTTLTDPSGFGILDTF